MGRSLFHQLFRRIFASQPGRLDRRRHWARPQIEALETRLTPDVTIGIVGGVLTVNCNGINPNRVILDHSGTQTLVNGQAFSDGNFNRIAINGNFSDNDLRLLTTVRKVDVNAGSGSTNVTIGLVTGQLTQQADINVHSGSGLLSLTINDQNTPTRENYDLTTTFFFRTNMVSFITWSGNSLSSLTVNTGRNFEFINVDNPAFVSTVVNAGPAGNQIAIGGTSAGRTLTVNTGGGTNNSVFFSNNAGVLANAGNVTVNGQGSGDQLILDDSSLTTSQTYTVTANSVSRTGIGSIRYSGINFLRLDSGRAAETVNIEATGAARTQINAGPGNNQINVHDASGSLEVNTGISATTVDAGSAANQLSFTGAVTVKGQGRAARLNVNDQNLGTAETYTITSISLARTGFTGSLSYSGLGTLSVNTGMARETVNVPSTSVPATTINAGAGGNTINVAATASGVIETINAGPGGDTITTTSAQRGPLRVNGQGGTTALIVDDRAETAAVPYFLGAIVLGRDATINGPIIYSGLSSVQLFMGQAAGNVINLNSTAAGVDTQITTMSDRNVFQVVGGNSFDGPLTLNGSGTDKLVYLNFTAPVYVNLQTGEATALTAFSGIRDVTGGQGNNILVGDGHGNTLDSSRGGRSLLIAGGSDLSRQGDTLIGSSDEDILIAGFTVYDLDKNALQAILAEWTRTDLSYNNRVNDLTTGANGVPLLDATTVFSNQANNTLQGNGGLDLFFANLDRDGIQGTGVVIRI
jgi:hypothetical protein